MLRLLELLSSQGARQSNEAFFFKGFGVVVGCEILLKSSSMKFQKIRLGTCSMRILLNSRGMERGSNPRRVQRVPLAHVKNC